MKDVIERKLCCGCHACGVSCPVSCIEMVYDEEGFLYPEIDQSICVECGKCQNVCPVRNKKAENSIISAFASYIKNDNIRKKSSSGGLFYAIASYYLETLCGIVFGAGYDEKFHVRHMFVDKIEDISKLMTSKYVQSEIKDNYVFVKKFLNEGRHVLFSGTPCQIAGLKSFLNKEYKNLLLVSIICHGVPSPVIWDSYVEELEKKGVVKSVNFRDKKKGWEQYHLSVVYDNIREYNVPARFSPYINGFLSNIFLRNTCYNCSFKGGNYLSDITLGDFWGVDEMEEFKNFNDHKGLSIVLLHSTKGDAIFEVLKRRKMIIYKNIEDIENAISFNSALYESVLINPKREAFFHAMKISGVESALKDFCVLNKKKYYTLMYKIKIYNLLKKLMVRRTK